MSILRTTVASFLVASAACVAALSLGGGAPQQVPEGLPDPGPLVGWSLPLASVVSDGLLVVLVGALAWAVLRWTIAVRRLAVVLGVVLASLVPVAFAGHSASSGSHDLAALSLLLHLVGVCLWVGGLVALTWVAWRGSKRLAPALRRYSVLALWAFVVVGVSGVVNAAVRLRSVTDVVGTGYGQLVLAKVVALVALGWFGWVQRRRLADRDAGFLSVATSEVLLMAATIGLAVALSRTPTPVGDILTTPAQELLGGPVPPAPDVLRMALGFTPNGLGLTIVVLGAALYVRGLLVLRRRGDVVTVWTREAATLATHAGATALYTLPAGFRPDAAHVAAPVLDDTGADLSTLLVAAAGGSLTLTAVAGERHHGSLTYLTSDTWPGSLPGTEDT